MPWQKVIPCVVFGVFIIDVETPTSGLQFVKCFTDLECHNMKITVYQLKVWV
jgi:hypothetical protein